MGKKLSILFITLVSAIIIIAPIRAHAAGVATPGVTYKTHVQTYGWQGYVSDGALSGTVGQSKRLEAINIKGINLPAGAHLQYEVQVQTYGWQGLKSDGQEAGTDGQSKRLEAIKIKLVGMPGYSVEYKVQVQTYGWQGWVSDGALSGTVGQSKRLEAIEIKIIPPVIVHTTTVSLNKMSDKLTVGDTDNLISTVNPANSISKAVTWESSNASIATVDNAGKVTGVKAGTATITVTTVDGSKTATCTVTVNDPIIKVTSVSLNITTDSLVVGSADTLTSTVNPIDATNKDVTWTSSDASIATVDNTGKVTAVRAGTATITATTVDGSKISDCTVIVSNKIIKVTSVSLNKTTDSLVVGSADTLTSTVNPIDATNKDVTWTSSDASIAAVDNAGKVTAVSAGTAIITTTTVDGNFISSCTVSVESPKIERISDINDDLYVGDNYTLPTTVMVNMNNGTQVSRSVVWESTSIDTSGVGLKTYYGTVDGYESKVQVNLNVKSIASDIRVTGVSRIVLGSYLYSYGITLTNYIPKVINIEKVEIYENGILNTTFSKDTLISSGISTVINANSQWGISLSWRIGFSAKNSYIIVYINNNGQIIPCEYPISVD